MYYYCIINAVHSCHMWEGGEREINGMRHLGGGGVMDGKEYIIVVVGMSLALVGA